MNHFNQAHWEFAIQWNTGREWMQLGGVVKGLGVLGIYTSAADVEKAVKTARGEFKEMTELRIVRRLVEEWEHVNVAIEEE